MLLKLSIKLFTVCIMFTNVLSDNTCNILSLSGGGSFGAVEAGILKDLFSKKLIENEFDIITGISAGGLNAGFISSSMNISNTVDDLISIYETLTTNDVYKKDHVLEIFKTWGYYDTSPLEKTITKILSEQTKITDSILPITLIGASNLNLEQLDVFRYDLLPLDSQIDILMATSAIPMLFPPRRMGDYIYIDGGAIDNEMIYQAMGQKECNYYNYVFISASDKSVDNKEITSYKDYLKSVVRLVLDTFDYQLAGMKNNSCSYPQGIIKACFPDNDMLTGYSILDFDHGKELVDIGMNHYSCEDIKLC